MKPRVEYGKKRAWEKCAVAPIIRNKCDKPQVFFPDPVGRFPSIISSCTYRKVDKMCWLKECNLYPNALLESRRMALFEHPAKVTAGASGGCCFIDFNKGVVFLFDFH